MPDTPSARFDGVNGLNRRLSAAVITFHEAVSRQLGLTAGDRKCLGVLAELGEATPGQLARATGLTTGAITGIVDRLERAGYAARAPNPDDRRSLIVRAARQDELARLITPIFAALTRSMDQLYQGFTDAELATVERYLTETIAVLTAEAAKLEA